MREKAFLLTRQWRDTPRGVELTFWAKGESGPVRIQMDRQKTVCFVERGALVSSAPAARRRPLALRTPQGAEVDALYFRSQAALVEARRALRAAATAVYESDIKPSDRFLMERFLRGGISIEGDFEQHETYRDYRSPHMEAGEYRPSLSFVSLDIETGGFDETLYSVAVTSGPLARVFVVRSPEWDESVHGERLGEAEGIELSVHHDETTLIEEFFSFLAVLDPDLILGWNLIDFDLWFLERLCQRLNLAFALGRGRDRARLLSPSGPGAKRVARIPGRVALDGIDTLRNATWSFEDYGLDAVAREVLGEGKLIEQEDENRIEEIRRLYREEPWELARYNVSDCRLVERIFERTRLLDFVVERARLTGLALDRVGGSVAAFDNLYLPRLHRKGRVARDVEERPVEDVSPGGYVMDSEPGLFDNVLVLDFKSLYPSIVRTFLVDPLGLWVTGGDRIPGFRGASFSRDTHILPGLIEELWGARDQAKKAGNDALSRAIKILMNSFYGVLGTTGCRFFDPRLASSITLRGHEIITGSRKWIEEEGHRVVYGDTDSLFVMLGPGSDEKVCRTTGEKLASGLNRFWAAELSKRFGIESHLEIQFETHYLRFFMPTIRGSELGSKKRYAGLVRRGDSVELRFTGLEAVRSDWTPLAREFQRELYRRVFLDQPFEDYVRRVAAELLEGKRDRQLVYRKRLRRRLEDYVKNVPPHAQAARKSKHPGRWVRYVVTTNGPEPVDNNTSRFDYQHYLDRQLAPAGDALLALKGTSVGAILDAQLSLF